jgi:hypothetical protein
MKAMETFQAFDLFKTDFSLVLKIAMRQPLAESLNVLIRSSIVLQPSLLVRGMALQEALFEITS